MGSSLRFFSYEKTFEKLEPRLNVPRRHESVATDTIKQAQVFVGRDSLVADVYPMKSGKQFVNTLEDNIRR